MPNKLIIVFSLAGLLFLSSCSSEPESTDIPISPAIQHTSINSTDVIKRKDPQEKAVYTYKKRNPFKKGSMREDPIYSENIPPVDGSIPELNKRYEAPNPKVTGIVAFNNKTYAIVEMADQSYTVETGDKFSEYTVRSIKNRSVCLQKGNERIVLNI
ncbi:MAG: hypothetical protein V1843_05170 [bacterium]